jgi:hypothetical protein
MTIDSVIVRRPAGGNQSHHDADSDVGGLMLDDMTPDEDCGASFGKELSSLWLCAGPEETGKVIGASAPTYQG